MTLSWVQRIHCTMDLSTLQEAGDVITIKSKPAIMRTHFSEKKTLETVCETYRSITPKRKITKEWLKGENKKIVQKDWQCACDDYAKKVRWLTSARLRMHEMTTGDVTLVFGYTGLFLTFGVAFRAKKAKAFSPLSESYLCNKNEVWKGSHD